MGTPKKLVLIVDDEEDVARYLSAALSDEGFDTLTLGEAKGVLDLAVERRPDLICLDLVLPGQTGLSLYQQIRETPELAGTPIVVVTGLVPADAIGKVGLGETLPPPDAFVEKPVDIPKFVETVRNLVREGG